MNVPHISELYVLYSVLEGDQIDLGPFLVNQLYNAAHSFAHRIVISGLITPIAGLVGVKPNPDDRVGGLECLNLAAFEQMKFVKLMVGVFVGFIPGTGLCLSQMLVAPLS